MRPFALVLALALFSVTARGETNRIRGSAAPVTVYTQFETEHAPAIFEALKVELASLMAATGLEFEWRLLDGTRTSEPSVELVVVSFKGSCRMEHAMRPHGDVTGALGWTHTTDGVVLPFADVDCDRIRKFIAHKVAHESLHDREMLLGRAVGRVLAHEMYHIFARTRRHGKAGIAKPFYTASELVSESFVFEQKESKELRTLALPALIRAGGPLPRASALTGR